MRRDDISGPTKPFVISASVFVHRIIPALVVLPQSCSSFTNSYSASLLVSRLNRSMRMPSIRSHMPSLLQLRCRPFSPYSQALFHTSSIMTAKTQEPVITKTSDLPIEEAKWVTLKKIEYVDQIGKTRTWEVATRKTRGKAGVDAVAMGNILLHPTRPPSTMLVIQYRPPLDAYTVEWPAGLIDAEETAEQAAVREFKEETGYDCRVMSVSPPQAADPGLSNANMQLVMVEAQLGEEEEMPEQRLDDGERIERVIVPLAEFYDRLVEYSKQDRMIVAAKLFHFAAGMNFAKAQKYPD
ncbi:NUDIX domain-containing protein [Colletotrichum graminicola]|nr:NUDIX domain-containing protein [Colletotrichum graminicola]